MFKIGDKVMIGNDERLVGYIVSMTIDPLEEYEVKAETEFIVYVVRVFKPFYSGGYTDFTRMEHDLCLAPIQLNMFDMMT